MWKNGTGNTTASVNPKIAEPYLMNATEMDRSPWDPKTPLTL